METKLTAGLFLRMGKLLILNALFLSLIMFTGCGKQNKIVKDLSIKTSLVEGDVWMALSAAFDLGGMSMTGIKLPIVDPNDKTKVYGEISFQPTLDGNFNQLAMKANLTTIAKVQGGVATLPNGDELPIGNIDNRAKVIELKVDEINAKIYVALDHNLTLFGFAIAIKEFDSVASYVGGTNIFFGFNINKVRGMAGLFTSSTDTTQSGLGFFVDLSSVVTTDLLNDIITGTKITKEQYENGLKNSQDWDKSYYAELDKSFKDKRGTKSQERKAMSIINKMGKNHTQLHYLKD